MNNLIYYLIILLDIMLTVKESRWLVYILEGKSSTEISQDQFSGITFLEEKVSLKLDSSLIVWNGKVSLKFYESLTK